MSADRLTLDTARTDDDGEPPLGDWVEIGIDEWRRLIAEAGGLEALSVFSSLTDPEGVYGSPQVYTAWGRREDGHPLVDVRDLKGDDGRTVRSTFRRFVPRASQGGETR